MQIGYHSITWGGVVGAPSGVTSVKDLYYRASGSMDQALRDIAAAGYEGVEVFDGNVVEAPGGRKWWQDLLAATGLELASVYSGANFIYADVLPEELSRLEIAAEHAAALGAHHLVVGGGARRVAGTTETDYRRLGQALDSVVELAERHGLRASYHPHLGTMAESPHEIEQVMSRSRIDFCPDTAHLLAGGGDPGALVRRYADRLAHVHLKDLTLDPVTFLPLGRGVVDFADVLSALKDVGYDNWLMVELDSYEGDPAEAASSSKTYLTGMLS